MAYIYKAGVVGGGTMGSGIAYVISYSGIPVVLKEIDKERAQKAYETIKSLYEGRVKKGKITEEEAERRLALVEVTDSYEPFSDVDIVIEAVFEDLDVKIKVFQELENYVPEHTILATNTSALSITAMAAATKRPDKVIGMHFFFPAPVMKLVEVIPALQTSEETVQTVIEFSESLSKLPIRVEECPGFLVNRILMAYMNEAAWALLEGEATAEEIDAAAREFGWPMGPFTLIDELGVDVGVKVAHILYEGYGERMRPAPILDEIIKEGRFGKKAGAGVYDYGKGVRPIEEIAEKLRKELGIQRGEGFDYNRLMIAMINEAILTLQERVASPRDIDLGMLAGTGFPQARGGGPLMYADIIGLDEVLKMSLEYEKKYGWRFHPSYLLKKYIDAGWLGKKSGKGFFEHV
ncbi:MAG: 3-hydroxyacyl-CoA dehydrogenase [candidate division WOR-3 bacterium]